MKRVQDVSIGDILTLSISLKNMDKSKQRTVFGIDASPFKPNDPQVLVIDDVGEERWIFLRTFEGFYDLESTVAFSSREVH